MAKKEDIDAVFIYWRTVHETPRSLLTQERRQKIAARLDEGYSVADINHAIHGILLSPHHRGENDRSTTYLDIYHVCKSGRMLEKFSYLYEREQNRQRHASAQQAKAAAERRQRLPAAQQAQWEAMRQKLRERGQNH